MIHYFQLLTSFVTILRSVPSPLSDQIVLVNTSMIGDRPMGREFSLIWYD